MDTTPTTSPSVTSSMSKPRKRRHGDAPFSYRKVQDVSKIEEEIDFAFRKPTLSSSLPRSISPLNSAPEHETNARTKDTEPSHTNNTQNKPPIAVITPTTMIHSKRQLDQDQIMNRLECEVDDLNQLILDLNEYYWALNIRIQCELIRQQERILHFIQKYFSMFRNGFKPSDNDQIHFLHSVLTRDVEICSRLRGIDAFVHQWIRYMQLFHLHSYSMQTAHCIALDTDEPIVEVVCSFRLRVTSRAVMELFPHICSNAVLVSQLINQELFCGSRTTFSFNKEGKVCRYDNDFDFVPSLSRILQDPIELEYVMNGALIYGSLLGPLDYKI